MGGRHGSPAERKRRNITVVVAALIVAVGVSGWQWLTPRQQPVPVAAKVAVMAARPAARPDPRNAMPRAAPAVPPPASATIVPARSIAVLPFVTDGDNAPQFFSDGLSQGLITALSQFSDLKVIGSQSSFHLRNSHDSSAGIGRELGVAYLLEGSARRTSDRIRVTATLVATDVGKVVWSQHFDKPYTDLFALQDAITRAVATALQAKPLTAPGAVAQDERPASGNLDAWLAYQRGVALREPDTEASLHDAIAAFKEAVRLDPLYTSAYARLSRAWSRLAARFLHGAEAEQAYARARTAARTALTFDATSALAHAARAHLIESADLNFTRAGVEYRDAQQLAPNEAAMRYGLAHSLAMLGHNRQAIDLARQALASDPRHGEWHAGLAAYLAAVGQLDAARRAVQSAITLQPGVSGHVAQLARLDVLRGDVQDALAAAQRQPPGLDHDFTRALALQIGSDRAAADLALDTFIADYASVAAYRIAEIYALRQDPYDTFRWLDRAWGNRDPDIGTLLSDPIILRYRSDVRFGAFCKRVGLPATTDAVAMK